MRAAINLPMQTLTYRSYIRAALCFQKLESRIGTIHFGKMAVGCRHVAFPPNALCRYSFHQSERTVREASLPACLPISEKFLDKVEEYCRIPCLPGFCCLERLTQKRDKESFERRDEALARFTADPSRECARSLAAFRTRVVSLARACATRQGGQCLCHSFVRIHAPSNRPVTALPLHLGELPCPPPARSLVPPRPAHRKRDEFLRSDSYTEPGRGTLAILIPACDAPAN